jgi:uncharacterized membrane protein
MTTPDRPPDPAPAAPGSLRVTGRQGWDQHPGVRTGHRLRPGEHVADVLSRVAGSWTYLIMIAVGTLVAVAAALPHDGLAVALSALALIEVSLVLMAARRAERIATELALYNLDQARRATAVAEDLRDELGRLHADVARIAAHTDIAGRPARRT